MPGASPEFRSADRLTRLADGDLEVVGQLSDASNAALLVRVGESGQLALYKPVRGERPLWDFPEGTLAAREVAACLLSETGGWYAVPPTVLRDGPLGPGSVQEWVGSIEDPAPLVVRVVSPKEVEKGWIAVLSGEDAQGRPLVVVHPDTDALRSVAVFDALINNADRKGSHLLESHGRVLGIDHGVSFHHEPKLRTVLWAWAGQPIADDDLARVRSVVAALADETSALSRAMGELLTSREVRALAARGRALLEHPTYPMPSADWPSVPWPPV